MAALFFVAATVGGQAKNSESPRTSHPLFLSQLAAVSLERKGCYGPCPVYSVSLRNDDRATYVGISHVDRLGTYTGTVFFQQLGLWLENLPTLVDKSETLPVVTDGEAVGLTLQFRDSKKIGKQFGTGSERTDLWAAAEVIDGVSSKVHWQKAQQK